MFDSTIPNSCEQTPTPPTPLLTEKIHGLRSVLNTQSTKRKIEKEAEAKKKKKNEFIPTVNLMKEKVL